MRKNIKLYVSSAIVSLALALGIGVFVFNTNASGGDCSANSVITCGVSSTSELNSAISKLPNLYKKYGVEKGMKVVEGSVTKSGNVIVGGETIATGAHSVGRQNMAGSTKITSDGQTFYDRPTSTSFKSSSLAAYVFLKADGTFSGAVIKDCGNPVKATPVPPKPKPAYACSALTATKINDKAYTLTAQATATNGAKIVGYDFNFGDGTVKSTTKNSMSHTYTKAGNYKASVTVKVSVDGKTVNVNDPKCAATTTVAQEVKNIEVCEISTSKIITIDEKQFDSSKHSKNLNDCEKIEVCDLTTKKVVTIKKNEYDSTKHSKDLNDCVEKIKVCELEAKTIIEIKKDEYDSSKHSTNLDDCKEVPPVTPPETPKTPETPVAELPQTGMADTFGSMVGLGSLAAATYYYRASRRM